MPGQIAPAYVAVDANRLSTRAGAGWFGGGSDDGEGVHFQPAVAVDEDNAVHAPLDRSGRCGGDGFVLGWIGHPVLTAGVPRFQEAMRLGAGLRHGLALLVTRSSERRLRAG
jgi:hypothetical protein